MILKTSHKNLFLSTLSQSKYFLSFDENLSEKEKYRENINKLLLLLKKKNVNLSQIQFFVEKQDTGAIFVYIPDEEFEMFSSLFKLFIKDSLERNEIYSQLKKYYKIVIEKDQTLALLFEIVAIKLLLHIYSENNSQYDDNKQKKIDELREILKDIRNELYSVNIFNREFQTKIFDITKIDSEEIQLEEESFRESFVKKYDFSYVTLKNLLQMFNTAASLDKEISIIDYFENRTVWSVDDILKPDHVIYFPFLRKELQDVILKSIIKKSKQTRDFLLKEKEDLERQLEQIKNDMNDSLNNFFNNIKKETIESIKYPVNPSIPNKINSFIIDFNRNIMANIIQANKLSERWTNLQKRMIKNENLRNFTYDQYVEILQNEGSIEKNFFIESILIFFEYYSSFDDFFEKFKPMILKVVKNSFEELKKEFANKKEKTINQEINSISELFVETKFSKKFNYDLIKKKFLDIMDDLINQLIISILFTSIKIYNTEKEKYDNKKNLYILNSIINLIPAKRMIHLSNKPLDNIYDINETDYEKLKNIIKKNYSNMVSVLVYDIRGSTYMSAKLNNAEKQKFIMKKFQHAINNAIKTNFGIPLKETGDGGISIFCSNSKDLYRTLFKETISSKNVLLRHSIATGSDLFIKESSTASLESIKCSLKMVETAETFIKDNYINYREWFFDVHEKKVIHEGIEYALLPPEFKSLFRIGVGISSGIVNRDVNIAINAFGDIDIYGNNINESKILSGVKNPNTSVIIIDHFTLFSAILNSNYIDVLYGMNDSIDKNLSGMLNFNQQFIIENVKVKFYGLYFPLRIKKDQYITTDIDVDHIGIDETGKIFYREDEVKLLFLIES